MDEPEGFAEFVRGASRGLLQTGWLLTGNWASAQDLVQTALAKTWPRWESISEPAATAYVRRVMMTTYLAWRGRRWTGESPVADVPEEPDGADAFEQAELRLAVAAALATLPARQRAVVVLRHFLDLSEAATAEALACSPSSVKTHHARALAALRRQPGLSGLAGLAGDHEPPVVSELNVPDPTRKGGLE